MKKFALILAAMLLLTGCGAQQPPVNDGDKPSTATATPSTIQPSPDAQDNSNREEIALSLVKDIASGDYEKAYTEYPYDKTMKKAINATFLEDQFWNYLVKTYGAYVEITGTVASELQGYYVIGVRTTFENAKILINIVFDANNNISGINQAVEKEADTGKAPEGVVETAVTFGKKGWELPGTLTVPKDGKDYPIVLLVHGSGPNDRDETVGPNKPFRDIAWSLAQKGIASLRYDKRTYVYGKEMASDPSQATVYEEAVEDATLAVQFIKENNITPGKIYILGHSLGGMLIPRIAQEAAGVSGYIILSGPVTPLEDLMVEQVKYLSNLDGTLSAEEKQAIQSYEFMRDNVKKIDSQASLSPEELFGIPAAYWLDLKDYKPAELAKKIDKPLLILQGERDYQVTMKEFNLWKEALGNKNNVTFKSYEGLNHLLMYGTEKSSPNEYNVPGAVDERVIEDIGGWIKNDTK